MLEFYQRYLRRKYKKAITLDWHGDWCYVIKDGISIGHVNMYVDDDLVKLKIKNLLKQLEK